MALGVTFGCSTEDPENRDTTGSDSGLDLGTEQTRVPVSVFEPDLPETGQFCSFLAAVECDGNEDCAEGQTCCGTLNGGALSYESIRCQDECLGANGGRMICHENDICPDPEQSCIRSIILPSYLGICGTPTAFTPEGFEAASIAAGEINCASGRACTGGQVCCSLTSWDAEAQAATFIDGRCADSAEECSCSAGTTPVEVDSPSAPDAGTQEGGLE